MTLFKKICLPMIGVALCWVIFQMANTARYFGVFINQFTSCVQEPMNSFPCYGVYDLIMMGLAVVIGFVLLAVIIFRTFQFFRRKAWEV